MSRATKTTSSAPSLVIGAVSAIAVVASGSILGIEHTATPGSRPAPSLATTTVRTPGSSLRETNSLLPSRSRPSEDPLFPEGPGPAKHLPEPTHLVITGHIRDESGRPLAAIVSCRPFGPDGPDSDLGFPMNEDKPGWVDLSPPLESLPWTWAGGSGRFEIRMEFARRFREVEGIIQGSNGIQGELRPWLLVQHPGFLPASLQDFRDLRQRDGPHQVRIDVGRIVLRQATTVRGRLRTADGRPISDTPVWLPYELKTDAISLVSSMPTPDPFPSPFAGLCKNRFLYIPAHRSSGHLAYASRTDADGWFELDLPESNKLWLECAPEGGPTLRLALGTVGPGPFQDLGDFRPADALKALAPYARGHAKRLVHREQRLLIPEN
jgi:hypothetical protein